MLTIVSILVAIGVLYWLAVKKNTECWYAVPFVKGEAFIATTDISGHFDRIKKGEVLIYQKTGFSRNDGYIGFFFVDATGKERRWDIHDSQDSTEESKKVFQKV